MRIYLIGKFRFFGKHQECPDMQIDTFKMMVKEVLKTKFTEATMFMRTDDSGISYLYLKRLGRGRYFGIGIESQKGISNIKDFYSFCYNRIIRGLIKQNLILDRKGMPKQWLHLSGDSFVKRSVDVGLFLNDIKGEKIPVESLTSLTGSVGHNAVVKRESDFSLYSFVYLDAINALLDSHKNGSFFNDYKERKEEKKNKINKRMEEANTIYKKILDKGYPALLIGMQRKQPLFNWNNIMRFVIKILKWMLPVIAIIYGIGWLLLKFAVPYDLISIPFERFLNDVIYFWK